MWVVLGSKVPRKKSPKKVLTKKDPVKIRSLKKGPWTKVFRNKVLEKIVAWKKVFRKTVFKKPHMPEFRTYIKLWKTRGRGFFPEIFCPGDFGFRGPFSGDFFPRGLFFRGLFSQWTFFPEIFLPGFVVCVCACVCVMCKPPLFLYPSLVGLRTWRRDFSYSPNNF